MRRPLVSLLMGKTMNLKRHVGALVAAMLLGGGLVGCAVEDERPAPYEPQVTHTPKAKKTDAIDADLDKDGVDEDDAGEDGTTKSGSEGEALEPPPIPAAIYEETLEGTEAAARYYLHSLEYGFKSGDSDPLRSLCDDTSETCATHVRQVERQQKRSWSFIQEPLRIEPATMLEFVEVGAHIEIPVYIPEYEIIGERGENVKN